jgi:hypothetical protein
MACSQGNLPTEEQFIGLLEEDAEKWISVAEELNPDWFSQENESATVKEKKEKNA